jgi:cyanate lyase
MAQEMKREDVTAMILSARKQAGLTWEESAETIGMSPVWTRSAAMGMNAMPPEKAALLVATMGLPQEAASLLTESPTRVFAQPVPALKDPCSPRRRTPAPGQVLPVAGEDRR